MAKRIRDVSTSAQEHRGKVTVMSMMGKGGDEEVEEAQLEVRRFEVEPAYVTAEVGVTKNLGDFESLRVSVRISVPCYVEEIDDTFDVVSDRVSDFLYDEIDRQLSEGK